jgi:hypothetical protein
MEPDPKKYQPRIKDIDIKTLLATDINANFDMQGALHRISIAPMMDVTNVHFRFFMRLLTRRATLWTEMIHENAILNSPHGH